MCVTIFCMNVRHIADISWWAGITQKFPILLGGLPSNQMEFFLY